MNCPICLNKKTTLIQDQQYRYCAKCGTVYLSAKKNVQLSNNKYFDKYYAETFTTQRAYKAVFLFFQAIYTMLSLGFVLQDKLIHQFINSSLKKIPFLEVGFGRGLFLANMLEHQADGYGLEASHTALDLFVKQYPHFAKRVNSKPPRKKLQALYSNALFEHIALPKKLIAQWTKLITDNGLIILDSVPVIRPRNFKLAQDINMWPDCHYLLYSVNSLELLFREHGYTLLKKNIRPVYAYKLMNVLLKDQGSQIMYLRDPALSVKGQNNIWLFIKHCLTAFFTPSTDLGVFIFGKGTKQHG